MHHNQARLALSILLAGGIGMSAMPAAAAGIGVVLMHGHGSWSAQFAKIVPRLEAAGYGVQAPELCWSDKRRYAGTAEECMSDVDDAIAALHARGYDKIVLAGHSMGASNAFLYAANHDNLAGLIAWAPNRFVRTFTNTNVMDAQRLVEQGKGDEIADFGTVTLRATPRALLSFEGPDVPFNEERLLPGISVPLFWIGGYDDVGKRDPTPLFELAQPTPLNELTILNTNHFNVPDRSIDLAIGWLDRLAASLGS